MKALIALVIVGIGTASSCQAADLYSIEATVTLHKATTQYEAAGRVCRLVDDKDGQSEELISQPKVLSTVGSPASFYAGSDQSESVSMDVAWPNEREGRFAICTITVKRGKRVLAKAKVQVTIDPK